MLHLACVYTGEIVFLSCLADSCDLRANPVTCLHVALPGSTFLEYIVALIHLITVDAGLQLSCCRANAGLLLNGCGISPRAACKLLLSCCQTASRLLLGTCCRAGGRLLLKLRGFQSYFLASFGPRFGLVFGLVRNPLQKYPKHTKTYMNHAFTLCFEPKDDISLMYLLYFEH